VLAAGRCPVLYLQYFINSHLALRSCHFATGNTSYTTRYVYFDCYFSKYIYFSGPVTPERGHTSSYEPGVYYLSILAHILKSFCSDSNAGGKRVRMKSKRALQVRIKSHVYI
jgi:hypothetical protein